MPKWQVLLCGIGAVVVISWLQSDPKCNSAYSKKLTRIEDHVISAVLRRVFSSERGCLASEERSLRGPRRKDSF
jgi:hypothetical protein